MLPRPPHAGAAHWRRHACRAGRCAAQRYDAGVTRRVLSIAMSVIAFACAAALAIAAFTLGGTFADARTEAHGGPGFDVYVRTPFVRAADDLVFDVVVRGADRIGIKSVAVTAGTEQIAYAEGTAAAGAAATSKRSETATLRGSVPATMHPGSDLYLLFSVAYLAASPTGATEPHTDLLALNLAIYDDEGLALARAERVGFALLVLGAWCWLVHLVAVMYDAVRDRFPGTRTTRLEQAALASAYLASAVVGYWLFAWLVATALGLDTLPWLVILVGVWLAAPAAWLSRRRHDARA